MELVDIRRTITSMEHAGTNPGIYCSPKCGLNFLRNLEIGMVNPPKAALFVRNPYSRLVSYYVNKVVYVAADPDRLDDRRVETIIEEAERRLKRGTGIGLHLGDAEADRKVHNWTFEQFVKWLVTRDLATLERHLRPQHLPSHTLNQGRAPDVFIEGVADIDYLLFQIEKLKEPETQKRFRGVFSIDTSIDLAHEFRMMRKRSNKTPRSKTCDRDVFNMTPDEMRKQKYIPSCLNKYYNEELAALVYNYYKLDFEKYDYSEDSYK